MSVFIEFNETDLAKIVEFNGIDLMLPREETLLPFILDSVKQFKLLS